MAKLTYLGRHEDGGEYATDGARVYQLVPGQGKKRAVPVEPEREQRVKARVAQMTAPEGEGAPKRSVMGDMGRLAMAGGAQFAGDVARVAGLESAARVADESAESWRGAVSPETQAEMQKRFVSEEGGIGPGLTSPTKIAGTVAESLLPMGAGMAGGASLGRIGIKAGMSPAAAGAVGGAVGEGSVAGIMGAGQVSKLVDQIPEEKIVLAEPYQQAYHSLPSTLPEVERRKQAREIVKKQAMIEVGPLVALATAAFGAPSGMAMGKIIGGETGKSMLSTMLKQGFLEGVVQEAPQSASEQYLQNRAIQRNADPTQPLDQDLAEAAVGGAVAGTAMGAAMAPIAHNTAEPPPAPNPPPPDSSPPEPAPGQPSTPEVTPDAPPAPEDVAPSPLGTPISPDVLAAGNARIAENNRSIAMGRGPVSRSTRTSGIQVSDLGTEMEDAELAPPPQPRSELDAAIEELDAMLAEQAGVPAPGLEATETDMDVESIEGAPPPPGEPPGPFDPGPPPDGGIGVEEGIEELEAAPAPQPTRALPPPAIEVDSEGNAQPQSRADAARRAREAKTEAEALAMEARADELERAGDLEGAIRLRSDAAGYAPQMSDIERARLARDKRLPEGLKDARLLRAFYQNHLQGMAEGLERNQHRNVVMTADGDFVKRLPSNNPDWFKAMNGTDLAMTVPQLRHAVKKAIAGKHLGKREARAIRYMLDEISGERVSAEMLDFAKGQRLAARKMRREAALDLPPVDAYTADAESAGELFEGEGYDPTWNGETRALFELYEDAARVDQNAADNVLESGIDDFAAARRFAEIIHGQNAGRGQEKGRREQGERVQAEAEAERAAAKEAVGVPPRREEDEPLLSDYDEKDIRAREEAAAARKKAEAEAEAKAEADKQRGAFTLTGSDRAVDEAEARGQGGLFDSASPARWQHSREDSESTQPVGKGGPRGAKFGADLSKRPSGAEKGDSTVNVPRDGANSPRVNPPVPESRPDNLVTDAKTLGDLGYADTLVKHGYRALDVPGQARVFKAMLSFVYDSEVFRSIVSAIPVSVMNDLVGPKFSAQDVLNNRAVLIHALATNNDLGVLAAAIDAIVSTPTVSVAEIPFVDFGRATKKSSSASETFERNSHEAATSALSGAPLPSEAQKDAGNYRLGHVRISGLDISIENPEGSIRTGIDGNGTPWAVKMKSSYGYIKGTVGKDKDHIDVFIKPGTPENYDGPVFIVDQKKANGHFDEHKVLIGWDTRSSAKNGYLENYTPGWKGIRDLHKSDIQSLKEWLASGETTKPYSDWRFEKMRARGRDDFKSGKGNTPPADLRGDNAGASGWVAGWNEANAAEPVSDSGVAVSKNTVFTDEAAEKARAILKAKLGQINSGIDPEILQAGLTLAGYHIEKGARAFAAYAKAMISDLGESIRPYLKSWYMGVKYDPRAANFDGMSTAAEVEAADLDAILSTGGDNVPSASQDLEQDSDDAVAENGLVSEDVPDPQSGSADGKPGVGSGQDDREGGSASGGSGVPGNRASSGRAPRNQSIRGGRGGSSAPSATSGDSGSGRGTGNSADGSPDSLFPPQATAGSAEQPSRVSVSEKIRLQKEAESIPVKLADPANIAETLPFLMPSQHEDVAFAERRFLKPDGYGVLFTNGTGTGKTFLALGVIKRMVKQGKKSGLIIVPSQKIVDDWIKSAGKLGLDLYRLESTTDAGRGVAITTYANLTGNRAIADRDYDFVVADEAHSLMQNEAAETTSALSALRAVTGHPDGHSAYATMRFRKEYDEFVAAEKHLSALRRSDETMPQIMKSAERAYDLALKAWNEKLQEVAEKFRNIQPEDRTRALFLSATPFAYEKNIQWAEGYLFEFQRGEVRLGNSNQGGYEQFMVQHFGYRIRYHKLTEPGPEVNRDLMQRQFNTWLRQQGVLSARMLEVDADYDRKFIYVDSKVGHAIDEGLNYLREGENGLFRPLYDVVMKKFDFLARSRLLEAIKAREMVPYIKQQMALGRKLVVFYDFNEGGGFKVFAIPDGSKKVLLNYKKDQDGKYVYSDVTELADSDPPGVSKESAEGGQITVYDLIRKFRKARPDLVEMDTLAPSPLQTLRAEFPNAMEYNGLVPSKRRTEFVNRFNSDDSPTSNLILAQKAANAGWSAHDTTGKSQRVLLNLGLPTAPTVAIQQEGRIYRIGQASDALFRYVNTGTSWERRAFAEKLARRAGTAENLAMGEQARGLNDSFVDAFENAEVEIPGYEGEGKGGKARDRMFASAMSEFDRAKTFYYAQLKKNSRSKSSEGSDYFATPEPLGLKMVEWARIKPEETLLEPSAGHGAIARWFPDNHKRTVIEPSNELASRLALTTNADQVNTTFEAWNIVNKRHVIVMNPPFGTGGKKAIEHLDKAFKSHLVNGGRIVALIPRGPAADSKFEKWIEETEGAYITGEYLLPPSTFERAGTNFATRVVVIDKVDKVDGWSMPLPFTRDYSNAEDIQEFFNRIENSEGPARPEMKAAQVKGAPASQSQASAAERPSDGAASGIGMKNGEFRHTKTGEPIYVATPTTFLGDDYKRIAAIAKKHGGWYNSYNGGGAIKGFAFKAVEARDQFLKEIGGEPRFSLPRERDSRRFGIPDSADHIHTFTSDAPLKAHPDYRAAKAGDSFAAKRLVQDLVKKPEHAFGDAIFVPVRTLEASGMNQIPVALAKHYSPDQELAQGIIQVNRSFHTGADPMERLVSRAIFSGPVRRGARYVLVDDVTTMGGTLADLANYIQSNGGTVVGTVVLTNASRAGKFSAPAIHVKLLERRFGNEIRQLFGAEPSALTADEARYLVGFRDADGLRNRAAKAEVERDRRIVSKREGKEPPLTSRQTPQEARPSAGLSVSEVEAEIGRAVLQVNDRVGLDVRVVQSNADLPAEILASMKPGQRPHGVAATDGTVYLIAGNMDTAQEARIAFAHEVIGHVGMEKVVDDWDSVSRRVNWLVRSGNPRAREIDADVRLRYPGAPPNVYVREFLALATERAKAGPVASLLSRVRAAIRRFLLRVGLRGVIQDADLDILIRQSEQYLRTGVGGRASSEGPMAFSNTRDGKESEDGQRAAAGLGGTPGRSGEVRRARLSGDPAPADWRKQTRASGPGGPKTLFRGTTRSLKPGDFGLSSLGKNTGSPSAGLGVWFTIDEREAGLYGYLVEPFNLDIRKPFFTAHSKLPEFESVEEAYRWRENLRAQGYDSIVLMDRGIGSKDHVVVFEPSQVLPIEKPELQWSMPRQEALYSNPRPNSIESKAKDWLADHLKTSRRVSLWSRTVGTMYNLANQRTKSGALANPGFKRVFDAGQNFLSDVSRIAVEAESMAPDLFRQMTTMEKALKTGGASKKDIAAISKAIYQGTLGDQKIYSDAELSGQFRMTPRQIGLYRQAIASAHKSLDDLTLSSIYRMAAQMKVPAGILNDAREKSTDAGEFLGIVYDEALKPVREELSLRVTETKSRVDDLKVALEDAPEDRAEDLKNALAMAESDHAKAKADKAALDDAISEMFKAKARAQQLKDEGYFPLMRFGKYTVDVVTTDINAETGRPDRIYFGMFETEAEANAMARIMQVEYPESDITTGIASQDDWKLFPGLTPEVVESFARMTGNDENELFKDYIRLAVSNRSAMKRLLNRKGVPGFSQDVNRTLATFILANARLASSHLHMGEMRKAVDEIPKNQGDIRDQATKLVLYLTNPQEEWAGLRGFMFFHFLGGSIASALTNLTQVPMVTIPYLSRFGVGAPARALKWMRPGAAPTNAAHKEALKRAEEEGIVSPQEVFNLMATARGGSLGAGKVLSSRPVQTALYVWGSLFSAAEQYNRRVTFNAAYDLALQRKEADPYAFAVKAVEETQFIYNRGNRPNWGRGIGAPLFVFKQFSISYLELLARMPTKQKLLMVALLVLAAGIEGLPFEEDLEDLIDTIAQWNGYAWSTRAELEEWAETYLGRTLGPLLTRGVSGVGIPIDVQARLGLGNLIPGTAIGKPSELDPSKEALEVLGAAGGVARSLGYAGQSAARGDWYGAIWSASPRAVQNAMKGVQMWQEGEYLDPQHRVVTQTTKADAVFKAVGFQPIDVANVQRAQRQVDAIVQHHRVVEDGIADMWARGIAFKKPELVQQARERLQKWNRDNPKAKIVIAPRQIAQRVKSIRLGQRARYLKSVPKELRQQAAEGLN